MAKKMNLVILNGNLVADPEIRVFAGEKPVTVARFRLATGSYKKDSAEFVECVAFNEAAKTLEQYVHKGDELTIVGSLSTTTASYKKEDGTYVNRSEVIIRDFYFGRKAGGASPVAAAPQAQVPITIGEGGFMNIPEGILEELPFN